MNLNLNIVIINMLFLMCKRFKRSHIDCYALLYYNNVLFLTLLYMKTI